MDDENADASPASYPGLAEVIESVQLLKKELSDGLKDIQDKLDAQDARIIAVEAFVKNAQNSVPDMDDEWRGTDYNDIGYDFSVDRARKDQGTDTAGKGTEAGSVGKEGEASKGAEASNKEAQQTEDILMEEASNRDVVMEGGVAVNEPEGDSMKESESVMDPSVIAAESQIESEGETVERTPSVVVKRRNQKLKILSSKKKRIRRPSRFQLSHFDH
ncbi:unnamed protein product [Arabis nemorensis]|uniref:Uncharacterized protein n=1 Tax=Arabis nemorensis TaxID=586526 RepID=A0A565ARX2_9BRAS|nr:unnamed protein product [Arabis nemorensis]